MIKPVAVMLPPSYMEDFFKKNRKILQMLNWFESIFGKISGLASWSDHYIIIAEKL
jgi:hypothetical protein